MATVVTTKRYSVLRYRFENLPATPSALTLSIFGVLETKQYTGGTNDGAYLQTGGTPAADARLTAKLELMSSATVYYLNRSASPINGCVGFQYNLALSVIEGDVLTITLDNQDLTQFTGDVSGVAVVCPQDSVAYLSQWVGFSFSHAGTLWNRGVGVRDAKFRSYTENVYGVTKAEK